MITSNEVTEDITEILNYFEEPGSLKTSETSKNEAKKQNDDFLSMLLGTLGVILLESLLSGKRLIKIREGATRTGHAF